MIGTLTSLKQKGSKRHALTPWEEIFGLATPEAFAAVQAFVAGAVAHGHVTAVRTGGRILLIRNHGGQRLGTLGVGMAVAVTIAISIAVRGNVFLLIGEGEFRHGTIDLFLDRFHEARHGEFGLRAGHTEAFAIAGDELQREPAENIVRDGRGIANFGVLGETARLVALMGKFADERVQRHAVLQGETGERSNAVHQTADGGTLLGHGDKQFTRLAVIEQADGQVTFVTGDVKFMGDGAARIIQPAAERLAGVTAQLGHFGIEFLDAFFQTGRFTGRGRHNLVTALVSLFGVERLGTFRTVAINGNAFQAHLPGLNVSVADLGHGAFIRHVDGLGDGAADEGLGGGHHFQVGQITDAPMAPRGLERTVKHGQMFRLQRTPGDIARLGGASLHYFVVRDEFDVFDGVVGFNMGDDILDVALGITQPAHGVRHTAIDDLQHAAAGEQFIFHQRDVGFHPRGIAIHEEGDGTGGCEHSHLRVAIP